MTPGVESGDFIVVVNRNDNSVALRDEGIAARTQELCQLSATPGAIGITTDPGGLYAVFGDRRNGIFSSSLRAVLSGGRRKYPINGDALCEQLVTGAVAGRETCFQGIERLDGFGTITIGETRVSFRRFGPAAPAPAPRFRNAQACIAFQLEVLRDRFREIGMLAGDRGVSMGLSGGYDSRLMLLLALEAGIPVQPFTFASAYHSKENCIALGLAQRTGLKLRRISVRLVDDLDDTALAANIDDAIASYDGRTNKTMGTFGDVHTGRTQRECLGDAALNLNGLGGELYRNRERLPRYAFSFKDWFSHYVIGLHGGGVFVSDTVRLDFEDRLARKYGDLLGMGKLQLLNRNLVRRWYREIWLPYFAGPRLSAENRVGPALMPFADGAVSAAALAATPYIGPHGEFEAALIRRIDEKIAALPSSYGPGFTPSPLIRRLRDLAMSLVPLHARFARHRVLARRHRAGSGYTGRWRERFGEPLRFLKAMKLPLNIDFLLQEQVSRDRTLYIAEFLYRHREHITVDA